MYFWFRLRLAYTALLDWPELIGSSELARAKNGNFSHEQNNQTKNN